MTMYKALVKDKDTKKLSVVEFEQTNITEFNRDLRSNGYTIQHSCTKEKYDLILEHTNCEEYLFSCKVEDIKRVVSGEISEFDLFDIYHDKKMARINKRLESYK